jgi:hypothetical protein
MSESKGIRVRADFNGLFGDILCLSHKETCLDAEGEVVTLHEGMCVTAFDEDADEQGNRDDLLASGTVERSPEPLGCRGSRWILRIDENGVRHESDLRLESWFAVDHLDVERLLTDWRWLTPQRMTLVARNAFADLFLRNESGDILELDVAIGKLTKVADSSDQFRERAATREKREEWFAETTEKAGAARGLTPNSTQCIGFSVPLVFGESGTPDTPYVADLYEYVSFLGDLNRQISTLPEGTKVRLHVKARGE